MNSEGSIIIRLSISIGIIHVNTHTVLLYSPDHLPTCMYNFTSLLLYKLSYNDLRFSTFKVPAFSLPWFAGGTAQS